MSKRLLGVVLLLGFNVSAAWAQDAFLPVFSSPLDYLSRTIPLAVPEGATLQVALIDEVRIKQVGQPIQGRLVEAVYAFDQEVIPVGSEVRGRITSLKGASSAQRILYGLNADFSPPRAVEVTFHEIVLPDGRVIPIQTRVTPGSGQSLQLVTTVDNNKKNVAKDLATQKMKEAVQEAKQKWDEATARVKQPGKMRRLRRYALSRLPVHPQYLDAGTVYFAELQAPLDFGSKLHFPRPVNLEYSPPCSLLAHAQLVTPIDSGKAKKDDPVEAVLTRPLFHADQLLYPQGTRLKGSVLHAQSARHFARNGQLRLLFHTVVLPEGMEQTFDTSLEAIQAAEAQNVRLDLEGGTKSTPSKRRYVQTGLSVLAATRGYRDSDAEDGVTSSSGSVSGGAAAGAAGYKLLGLVAGAFARSGPFALGLGILGASRSAYSGFVARGHQLVFPKGTAMEVGLWTGESCESPADAVTAEEDRRNEKQPPGGTQ
ncbi:MAG TPA: hypothetical protein VNN18_06125 [Candidatus Xenobia bacterium]|nr:hypothetical protein [Candidatus Xenobia bacterium]